MQDYNYVKGSCVELTIELDDIKTPPTAKIPEHFVWNLGAFLLYPWRTAYGGAWGRVVIANTSFVGKPLFLFAPPKTENSLVFARSWK